MNNYFVPKIGMFDFQFFFSLCFEIECNLGRLSFFEISKKNTGSALVMKSSQTSSSYKHHAMQCKNSKQTNRTASMQLRIAKREKYKIHYEADQMHAIAAHLNHTRTPSWGNEFFNVQFLFFFYFISHYTKTSGNAWML